MKSIIKLGLYGLTPSDLVSKANSVVAAMTGNANFATPVPDLATVTAAADDVKVWIQKANFGDKRAILMRRRKVEVLFELMRSLGGYVSFTANGDEDIILSSDFDIRRTPAPRPPVGAPVALEATRSPKTGEVDLDWKAVSGSKSYVVEMSVTDPAVDPSAFSIIGYTTKSRFTADSLTPGTYYWFRVKAVGPTSESSYSDPTLVMAA